MVTVHHLGYFDFFIICVKSGETLRCFFLSIWPTYDGPIPMPAITALQSPTKRTAAAAPCTLSLAALAQAGLSYVIGGRVCRSVSEGCIVLLAAARPWQSCF